MDTVEEILCDEQPCDEQPCDEAASPKAKELQSLYEAMLAGDGDAAKKLIEAAMPLAKSIARRACKNRRLDLDHVESEACLAMWKCIRALPQLKTPAYDVEGLIRFHIKRYLLDHKYTQLVGPSLSTRKRHKMTGKDAQIFKATSVIDESQSAGKWRHGTERQVGIEEYTTCREPSEQEKLHNLKDRRLDAVDAACETKSEWGYVNDCLDGWTNSEIAKKRGLTIRAVQIMAAKLFKRARDKFAATEGRPGSRKADLRAVASQCFREGDSAPERVTLWRSRTGLSGRAFYDRLREARSVGTFDLSV